MTPEYRLVVADLSGEVLDELPEHYNLQYSYNLMDDGAVSFQMPIKAARSTMNLLAPGERQIYVYRDSSKVWGGYLWNVSASDDQDLQFNGNGYFSILHKRVLTVKKAYHNPSWDQLDIAADLYTYAVGSLGFTVASYAPSGITRARQYQPQDAIVIADELQNLAGLDNGFDFDVDLNKVMHLYYPNKGSSLSNVVFELGATVRGMSFQIDATAISNEIFGVGAGEGNAVCTVTVDDAPSQLTYGLLQEAISFSDTRSFSALQDAAQGQLNMKKSPRHQPSLSVVTGAIPFGSFSVGDRAPVRADYGYLQINQTFRVIAITVALTNQGNEVVTVEFDEGP